MDRVGHRKTVGSEPEVRRDHHFALSARAALDRLASPPKPISLHLAAATQALQMIQPSAATDSTARRILSVALWKMTSVLSSAVSPLLCVAKHDDGAHGPVESGSALATMCDDQLVDVLHEIHEDTALALRRRAEERWHRATVEGDDGKLWQLWCDPAHPCSAWWPLYLAIGLWHGQCRDAWLRRKHPAYTLEVLEALRPTWTSLRATDSHTVVDPSGEVVADFLPAVSVEIRDVLHQGACLLRSVAAHRLRYFLVRQTCEQYSAGVPAAGTVSITGGFQELARIVGEPNSGKSRAMLKRLLKAHQLFRLRTPGGNQIGGLLSYQILGAAPGRQSCIEITLAPALLPEAVRRIKDNRLRRLVPMIDPAILPLDGIASRCQGAALAHHFDYLVLFALQADSLVTEGSVWIPNDELAMLARRSGLPTKYAGRLKDLWLAGGEDEPPFIEEPAPSRFRLADTHAEAHELLMGLGSRMLAGKRRQRRSTKTS